MQPTQPHSPLSSSPDLNAEHEPSGVAPASDHPEALRLWLRMLSCTQQIESDIKSKIRDEFGTTLARFDMLAQLDRAPEGMRMNELSRRMMVTGGNVTGITDQLVNEGLAERLLVPKDRRAFLVRMTPKGRHRFRNMAAQHEAWIVKAFAALSEQDMAVLQTLLGKVKESHQASL